MKSPLTAPADTASFSVQKDAAAPITVAAVGGKASVVWNPGSGAHTLSVRATDKAGWVEASAKVFRFGVGAASLATPNDHTRSVSVFPLEASAAPGATGAVLQWRFNDETTWRDAEAVTTSGGEHWDGATSVSNGASGTGGLLWTATDEEYSLAGAAAGAPEVAVQAPALLQSRVCFTYPTGGSSRCTAAKPLQLVTSAFGGRFPTADLGPAQVALSTGEMSLSVTDAVDSVAGVGRGFSSYDSASVGDGGVFGPGWSTVLGSATGAASSTLVDNRTQDGSFTLVSPQGDDRAYALDQDSGTYRPTGEGAANDDSWMTWSPASSTLTLFEPLGTVSTTTRTRWKLASGQGELVSVAVPGLEGDTVTSYDTAGNPVWLGEPHGAEVCTLSQQDPGCRGLKLTYTGSGAGVRVASVVRLVAGKAPVSVADYSYESGKLASVCGPDPDPAASGEGKDPLCEGYTYVAANGRTLLAAYAPAAQKPWRFDYGSNGRLQTVKRQQPTGSADAVWSVAYDLDREFTGGPTMSTQAMAQWGQIDNLPLKAYAVYGPGDDPGDVSTAEVSWVDATDQVTHTATHGPSGWLVETEWIDEVGNTTRTLDGTGWARVQDAEPEERPSVAVEASTINRYIQIPGPTNSETGQGAGGEPRSLLVDTYSPAVSAQLEDGTTGLFRSHTRFTYDDTPEVDPALVAGRPTDAAGGLVVAQATSVADADLGDDHDIVRTRYEYAPVVAGDGDGWQLGTPTRTKRQHGSGWSTTINRFNAAGDQIEIRRPGGAADASGAGTDALSTTTRYYTADEAGECGNKPAWVGQICATGPSAQPDTGPGAPSVPTTRYTSYTTDGQPLEIVESSGASTRTTTVAYDNLGRMTTQTKTLAGAGVDADTVTQHSSYNSLGLVELVSSAGKSVSTAYDTWGRTTSTVDAHGTTSTTTYTAAGQVASFDDSTAKATYSFGAHGELSSVNPGGGIGAVSYHYNRAGQVAKVTYPNGMDAVTDYTETGTPIGLDYSQGDVGLASFTAQTDAMGRTVAQLSSGSAQDFTFDDLGRLTRTQDRRAGECLTRSYGFDEASNRTHTKVFDPAEGGECQSATPAVERTHVFDSAGRNRTTTGSGGGNGYVYDTFGRTLTLPGTDTSTPDNGDTHLTYAVDDMVATITQPTISADEATGAGPTGVSKMTYTLDPTRRIDTITTTIDGTETKRLRYRYTTHTDSPSQVETSTDHGNTWTSTRYITAPGLGMVATTTTGQPGALQIANLHGDIVATIPTTPGANVIDHWTETDEYGNQTNTADNDDAAGTTPARYGYLGTHQRATDTPNNGLTLMGARLYNPATGAFLSIDSVLDGNNTPYTYPQEPIARADTTGLADYCYKTHEWKCGPGWRTIQEINHLKPYTFNRRSIAGAWGFMKFDVDAIELTLGAMAPYATPEYYRIQYETWNLLQRKWVFVKYTGNTPTYKAQYRIQNVTRIRLKARMRIRFSTFRFWMRIPGRTVRVNTNLGWENPWG